MRATKTGIGILGGAAALLLAGAPAAGQGQAVGQEQAAATPEGFGLAAYVPGDVFLFSAGRHNPEREFLDEYWKGVWQTFLDTGAHEDAIELVLTALNDDQRTEVERVVDRFGKLVESGDWGGLVHGEAAFGERMPSGDLFGVGAPVGPPEIVLLFRADEEVVAKNFAASGAILEALADEIAAKSGSAVRIDTTEQSGVALASFDLSQFGQRAPALSLSVGRRGDVLFYTLGTPMRDQVTDLLAGRGEVAALGSSERFHSTFRDLPAPEDQMVFFDMQVLAGSLGRMMDGILDLEESKRHTPEGQESKTEPWRRVMARVLDSLAVLDRSATVATTEGYSTYTETVTYLVPDARERAIYPVFGQRPPVADFARYLPAETTGFSVDGGIALDALYGFLEDSFHEAGPAGAALWKRWTAFQEEHDFDLEKDVLSWLDTASVEASFDLDGQPAWIFLLKVNDDEAARQAIGYVLETVPAHLSELAKQNPMLGMFAPRVQPARNADLEGFHDVSFGMQVRPMACGVRDGWILIGSSEQALLRSLATAAGEHDNVRHNETLMAKSLVPEGPLVRISFRDRSKDAEGAAAALGMVSMMGGMVTASIPDPHAKELIAGVLGIVGKLVPVVAAIDFYDSSASYLVRDGNAWRGRSVTHYKEPSPAAGAEEASAPDEG